MVILKLEMHSANTGEVTEIGRTIIYNVGGTARRGNYAVKVGRRKPDGEAYDTREVFMNPTREGSVQDYPRLTYNVWRLVIRALRSAFPEEK